MRFTLLLAIPTLVLTLIMESGAADEHQEGPVVLAIFAHADDEIVVMPLLTRYAREGARVYLAIVTDGRFGVTEHAGIPAGDELAKIRKREARCAAEELGINPPLFFGFSDGFTHKTDNQGQLLELLDALHDDLRSLFNELHPEVVITWGPEGGYGHSDHRIVSSIVTEVFQEGTGAWPKQLLFPGFSTDRLRNSSHESGGKSMQWILENWHPVDDRFLNIRVSYSEVDRQSSRAAYKSHASQYPSDVAGQIVDAVDHLYDGVVTLRSMERDGDSGTDH